MRLSSRRARSSIVKVSLPTSINTRSPRERQLNYKIVFHYTWEKSINGTIVRTESESDKREVKKSYDTIFPDTLSHWGRVEFDESEQQQPLYYLRFTFVYATNYESLCFGALSAPVERIARRARLVNTRDSYVRTYIQMVMYKGNLTSNFNLDSHSRSAVRAPPNKVEPADRLQLEVRGPRLEPTERESNERGGRRCNNRVLSKRRDYYYARKLRARDTHVSTNCQEGDGQDSPSSAGNWTRSGNVAPWPAPWR